MILKPKQPTPSHDFMIGRNHGKQWVTDGTYAVELLTSNHKHKAVASALQSFKDDRDGARLNLKDGAYTEMRFPEIKQLIPVDPDVQIIPTSILSDRRGDDFNLMRLFKSESGREIWLDDRFLSGLLWWADIRNAGALTFKIARDKHGPVCIYNCGVFVGLIMPVEMKNVTLDSMARV